MHKSSYDSPIGRMTICANDNCLLGLSFCDGGDGEEECFDNDIIIETKKWLDDYFCGRIPNWIPPFQIEGTPFRKKVLEEVMKIPYGRTVSYKDLATRLGMNGGRVFQAIGQALSSNRILIIIPCHRVIRSDGSLSGYAGGVERKKFLLDLEKCETKID